MGNISFSTRNFELYHIYDYYDEPINYSCRNRDTKQLYLTNFPDYFSDSDTSVFLNVPVTNDELTAFEDNKLTYQELYRKVKDRTAVLEYVSPISYSTEEKMVKDLPDDYLCKSDEYLNRC